MHLVRLKQEIASMEESLTVLNQFSAQFIVRASDGTLYTFTGWQLVDYEGAKGVVMDVAALP